MNLKLQLKILSFLQFCLWGSWLTTLGSYMFVTLKFDGASIGAVYSSLGIAAVFMPTLLGIVADKWLSAKWLYMLCHLVGAGTLFMAAEVTTPGAMFMVILLNSLAYCSAAKFFAPKRIKLCTAATERKTDIAHGAN